MRREERVTIQGPAKEQQPDGMSHRGAIGVPIWGAYWGYSRYEVRSRQVFSPTLSLNTPPPLPDCLFP